MTDARSTLLLPMQRGAVPYPARGGRWLFVNGFPLPDLTDADGRSFGDHIEYQQDFRPHYLALEKQGAQVTSGLLPDADFAGTMVLLGQARGFNEVNITQAWNRTVEGGAVVVAGDIRSGVRPLRKWVAGHTSVEGSLSKHHAVAFWLKRSGDDWDLPEWQLPENYKTRPGMFSADGVDRGSRLLAEQFAGRVSGRVADLGAGWGYLSNEAVACDGVVSIDLFEASHAALEAARTNVTVRQGTELGFHWHDVRQDPISQRFDWVIMNPPFHSGRNTDPDLGRAFISRASAVLVKGGRLLMVANTHLPYEADLKQRFKTVTQIAQREGFKVIEAVR